MKGAVGYAAWMIAVLAAAAALRLADLGNRPMHCDEAVHAIKFAALLEKHEYLYNPYEYHGPSLNFLTLPVAWAVSARNLTEISEIHLRLVPAAFGIALVGLVWLVRDQLGRAAACWAAVFAAVSPAMVFFSRYYIQEMLLVFFTFAAMAALWRLAVERKAEEEKEVGVGGEGEKGIKGKSPNSRFFLPLSLSPYLPISSSVLWLVIFGLCVGMMHASKETCVIALFSMAVAAAVTLGPWRRAGLKRLTLSGLAAAIIAAAVSALLFSSFFHNPRGVIDSYTTYFHYLGRASGEGSVGRHVYPWDYYYRILFWWARGGGPVWTEASIAALALVGAIACWIVPAQGSGRFARFLSIYSVLMTVIYTVMPYKTPWCALGFFHGMILLAGVGAAFLVRITPGYVPKALVIAVLSCAVAHLAWQARRASFTACADPNNPYVYAHTTEDVPLLAERVEEIAAASPEGRSTYVQVVCPDDDYWPLPWYLRSFTRVGWFHQSPSGPAAPVIITQPEMERSLLEYLYTDQPPGHRYLYVPVPPERAERDWQLRPHVPLRVYVRLDLWEAYRALP